MISKEKKLLRRRMVRRIKMKRELEAKLDLAEYTETSVLRINTLKT